MEVTKKSNLLVALEAASLDDLQDVRQRMGELHAELSTLKELEKLLRSKFDGDEPVATAKDGELPGQELEHLRKHGWCRGQLTPTAQLVVDVLRTRDGWMPITEVARLIGKSATSVKQSISSFSLAFDKNNCGRVRLRDPERNAVEEREEEEEEDRERIHDYLDAHGATKPAVLCSKLDIHIDRILELAEDEWFQKTPDGLAIA